MARGNRKPQGQPQPKSRPPSAMPSLPIAGDKKDSVPGSDPSRGRQEKQEEPRRSHTVTIILAVFPCLIGALAGGTWVLWDRWTDEIGEHQKTVGRAERAEVREQGLLSDRDQLRQKIAELEKDKADFKKLHPILEFYGPHVKFTTSYDIPKEAGSILWTGNCPATPCLSIMMRGITTSANGSLEAGLGIAGLWEGFSVSDYSLYTYVTPRRGCRSIFEAGKYKVTVVVEEVQYSRLTIGIGATVLDPPRFGFFNFRTNECPES
jgi:hypothetical protein